MPSEYTDRTGGPRAPFGTLLCSQSAVYAERFVDRILDAVTKLAELPRVGRQVPEANAEHIRELIVQSQRIIYAINDDQDLIHILALVHVRQDLQGQDDPPWR